MINAHKCQECDFESASDVRWVADPYLKGIDGKIHMKWLCDVCERESSDDI